MGKGAETTIKNVIHCTILDITFVFLFWVVQYNTFAYSSVHGPRWFADSWDTMEHSELPLMQSLIKAQEPSGWMMWPVQAQRHHWTDASSVDGASTTVGIVKMQEWCARVNRLCVL